MTATQEKSTGTDKVKIMFVDDEANVLQGLKRMLRHKRKEWDMNFANSGAEALKKMESGDYNIIISDMRMPGMDGAELLQRVSDQYPEVIRIILSGQVGKDEIMRSIKPTHQYLSKPCEAQTLCDTIDRASSLRSFLSSDSLNGFVSNMQSLPCLPEIYQDLVEELHSEEPSIKFVSRLIAQDLGMTAKILQVTNSAYFAVPTNITSPEMAVSMLGLETVSSLVLAANIFSQMQEKLKNSPISYDQLWQHSNRVSRLAYQIGRSRKLPKEELENAVTAGLLHDVGKIVLGVNFSEKYRKVLALAKQGKRTLIELEKAAFGASHPDIGAYLLGVWGLPVPIIEAVAFHNNPAASLHLDFSALTAVHVANHLVNSEKPPEEATGSDPLNLDYLRKLGVEDQLPDWEELLVEDE